MPSASVTCSDRFDVERDPDRAIGETSRSHDDAIARLIASAVSAAIAPVLARLVLLETQVAELRARPAMQDRGVWRSGIDYHVGDLVSHHGAGWICRTAHYSTGKDLDHQAWRLFVKAGRDGKDAR